MRDVKVLTMILAGGIGERLYPLTANRSKPAVPFGGNFRIIDFTLMNCVLSGLRNIHLLTQYHSLSLGRHKSERWNFFSSELGEFLEIVPPKMRTATGFYHGTADAIYRNLDLLDRYRPDVVLILSGDHIYRADYQRFIRAHVDSDADVTVLTDWIDQEGASSFGVVQQTSGRRIECFVEKPADPSPYATNGRCQINLGVYCFQTNFLVRELCRDGKQKTAHDFGKNILPRSLSVGEVRACPLELVCPDERPYWRDVGTIDSYYRANMDCLEDPTGFDLEDPRWHEGSRFREWLPSRFPGSREDSAESGRNLISNGCDVAPATVDRSILSTGVRIEQGAMIDRSIILPHARIGRNVRLKNVIVEEGVRIPDGVEIVDAKDGEPFVQSSGGIIVIPAGYRFDAPRPSNPRRHRATHASSVRSRIGALEPIDAEVSTS